MTEPNDRNDRPQRHAGSVPQEPSHEPYDSEIRFGILVALGAGLLALVLVCAVAMYFLFRSFLDWQERERAGEEVLQRPKTVITGARLLATPEKTLTEVRTEAEAALASYGWVDRDAGVAHIPIERAMEILAERGLPTRPELAPDSLDPTVIPVPRAMPGIEERPLSAEEESAAPAMDVEENR